MARVMIVEDDGLQAFFLSQLFEADGFEVIGPALTAERAIDLIGDPGCDVAVLDYNLDGTSEPIVVVLRRCGIPFLLLTGKSRDQLPSSLADAPLVSKPATPNRLLEQLRTLLA